MDFQSTILSRFDMIFILRDAFDQQKDQTLARHILQVHMAGGAAVESEMPTAEIDIGVLKRYVAYARQKCSPRLSEQESPHPSPSPNPNPTPNPTPNPNPNPTLILTLTYPYPYPYPYPSP